MAGHISEDKLTSKIISALEGFVQDSDKSNRDHITRLEKLLKGMQNIPSYRKKLDYFYDIESGCKTVVKSWNEMIEHLRKKGFDFSSAMKNRDFKSIYNAANADGYNYGREFMRSANAFMAQGGSIAKAGGFEAPSMKGFIDSISANSSSFGANGNYGVESFKELFDYAREITDEAYSQRKYDEVIEPYYESYPYSPLPLSNSYSRVNSKEQQLESIKSWANRFLPKEYDESFEKDLIDREFLKDFGDSPIERYMNLRDQVLIKKQKAYDDYYEAYVNDSEFKLSARYSNSGHPSQEQIELGKDAFTKQESFLKLEAAEQYLTQQIKSMSSSMASDKKVETAKEKQAQVIEEATQKEKESISVTDTTNQAKKNLAKIVTTQDEVNGVPTDLKKIVETEYGEYNPKTGAIQTRTHTHTTNKKTGKTESTTSLTEDFKAVGEKQYEELYEVLSRIHEIEKRQAKGQSLDTDEDLLKIYKNQEQSLLQQIKSTGQLADQEEKLLKKREKYSSDIFTTTQKTDKSNEQKAFVERQTNVYDALDKTVKRLGEVKKIIASGNYTQTHLNEASLLSDSITEQKLKIEEEELTLAKREKKVNENLLEIETQINDTRQRKNREQEQKAQYALLELDIDRKIKVDKRIASGQALPSDENESRDLEDKIKNRQQYIKDNNLKSAEKELNLALKRKKAEQDINDEIFKRQKQATDRDNAENIKKRNKAYKEMAKLLDECDGIAERMGTNLAKGGDTIDNYNRKMAEFEKKRIDTINRGLVDADLDKLLSDNKETIDQKKDQGQKRVDENERVLESYKKLIEANDEYYELLAKKNSGKADFTDKDAKRLDELSQARKKAIAGEEEYVLAVNASTKAVQEAKKAQDTLKNADKTYSQNTKNDLQSKLSNLQNQGWSPDIHIKSFNADVENLENRIQHLLSRLPLDIVTEKDIAEFQEILTLYNRLDKTKGSKNNLLADADDIAKLQADIQRKMSPDNKMSMDMRQRHQNLFNSISSMGGDISRTALTQFREELQRLDIQMQRTGQTGKSFFGIIGDKMKYMSAQAIAQYLSLYDLIRYIRQGVEVIKEFDAALTEMDKVSEENIKTLRKYQKATFDVADAIGGTAIALQQSTADWMRLGEAMEDAATSAQATTILMNVSEFDNIDSATESLVSMSAAYSDLEKMDIVDIMNHLGNNFAISTDGLATALQTSASALQTAKNDMYEAAALATAANTIVQDPDKVGNGLRTIALRLTGTSTAKEELESMGEDTSDFTVTTISKMDEQIRNLTRTQDGMSVSLLDMNGNYRSTYEILLDIAEVWDQIAKEDLETGQNRQNALLELIAGKNRANIASSILSSPDVLKEAYEYAQDSEGSALKENEAYLESIQGHIDQLTNSYQSLWANSLNREVINFFIHFAKVVLDVAGKIGLLKTAGIALAGVFIIKNFPIIKELKVMVVRLKDTVATINSLGSDGVKGLRSFGQVISQLGGFTQTLTKSTTEYNAAQMMEILTSSGRSEQDAIQILQKAGLATETAILNKQTIKLAKSDLLLAYETGHLTFMETILMAQNAGLTISFELLAKAVKKAWINFLGFAKLIGSFMLTPIGLIVGAIAATVIAIKAYNKSVENTREKMEEATSALESTISELESLNDELETTQERMDELQSMDTLSLAEEEELAKLKEQNAELERRKSLLEAEKKINARTALNEAAKYNNKSIWNGWGYESPDQGLDRLIASYEGRESYLENIENILGEYSNKDVDELTGKDKRKYKRLDRQREGLETQSTTMLQDIKDYYDENLRSVGEAFDAWFDAGFTVDDMTGSQQEAYENWLKISDKMLELSFSMEPTIENFKQLSQATQKEKLHNYLTNMGVSEDFANTIVGDLNDSKDFGIVDPEDYVKYWESDFNYENFMTEVENEMRSLGRGGQVDLFMRPVIDTSELENAGWGEQGEGQATLYSSTYSNEDDTIAINFTPILTDSEGNYLRTLTPKDLKSYANEVISGVREDDLGLQIGGVFEGNDAVEKAIQDAERIHELQGSYYQVDGANLANAWLGTSSVDAIPDFIGQFLEGFNDSNFEETKKEILELAKSGELSSESLESIEEYANLLGSVDISAELAKDQIMNTLDATEKLAAASQGMETLGQAFQEMKEEGFVTSQTLAELPEVFKELEGYETFEDIVGNTDSSFEEKKQAFEDLATAYLLDQQTLTGLLNASEKEMQQYIDNLKKMGVTNAEEVVKSAKASLESNSTLVDQAYQEYLYYIENKSQLDEDYLTQSDSWNSQLIAALGEGYEQDYKNWCELIENKANAYNQFVRKLQSSFVTHKGNYVDLGGSVGGTKMKDDYMASYSAEIQSFIDSFKTIDLDLGDGLNLSNDFGSDGSGGGSSSDPETFDWIEVAISRVQRLIERLGKTVSATYKSWSERNTALTDQLDHVKKEILLQEQAYDYYMNKANSVGLSDHYKTLVQNGAIKIEDISDEDLAERVQQYMDYYEKALEAEDNLQDLEADVADNYMQQFDNIATQYEEQLGQIEHRADSIDALISRAEAKNYIVSTKYYEELLAIEKDNIATLTKERDALVQSLNAAVASGAIKEGSSDWYEMVGAIQDVNLQLEEAETNTYNIANKIHDIHKQIFDLTQDMTSRLIDESEFLKELLSNEELFNEDGTFNKYADATAGLIGVEYNTNAHLAGAYWAKAQEAYAKWEADKSDTQAWEDYIENQDKAWDTTKALKANEQEWIDLMSQSYDKQLEYLQEIINKRKEELQAEKSLYDYQNSIEEKTKNIASLRKQLIAWSGDTSEEGRSKTQALTVQLEDAEKDLEETEYDKWISDQEELMDKMYEEYESFFDEKLTKTDELIAEMVEMTNTKAGEIATTLNTEATNVGITLSESMADVWSTEKGVGKVISDYSSSFSSTMTSVSFVLGQIRDYVSQMVNKNDKEAENDINEQNNTPGNAGNVNGNGGTGNVGGNTNTGNNAGNTPSTPNNSSNGSNNSSSSGKVDTSFFVYKKDSYPKSKLNKNTSIEDRLKYHDYDSSFAMRKKYYEAMGLGKTSAYTGTASQNKAMIAWMKKNGYSQGGFIGRAIKSAGEDGIAFVRKGEGIIPLTMVPQWNSLIDSLPALNSMVDSLSIMKAPTSKQMTTNIENHVEMNITLPNVTNYEQFKSQLQRDKQFANIVQSIAFDQALGRNSLTKLKY